MSETSKLDDILKSIGELEPYEGRELKNKMKERFGLHKESFPYEPCETAEPPDNVS